MRSNHQRRCITGVGNCNYPCSIIRHRLRLWCTVGLRRVIGISYAVAGESMTGAYRFRIDVTYITVITFTCARVGCIIIVIGLVVSIILATQIRESEDRRRCQQSRPYLFLGSVQLFHFNLTTFTSTTSNVLNLYQAHAVSIVTHQCAAVP